MVSENQRTDFYAEGKNGFFGGGAGNRKSHDCPNAYAVTLLERL